MPRQPLLSTLLLATVLSLGGALRPAAAFTAAEATAPMTVTLVRDDAPGCGINCPEWLALTGKIGFDTTPRLAAALARLGKRRVPVLLDSPGGEGLAGLAMGRMIRAHGLDTIVATTALTPCDAADRSCQARLRAGEHPGHLGTTFITRSICASACVFVLAGGLSRVVPFGALVGVHQSKRVVTYHPVRTLFRVLSRIVNGRKVEISRTLVSTQALPVRVVTSAAPASIYSEFDHFLLGMGIDESIMPLMRSAPPSGIHWLLPFELTQTHVATETTEAQTYVASLSEPPPPTAPPPAVKALPGSLIAGTSRAVLIAPPTAGAAAAIDEGTVRWWFNDPAPAGTPAVLQAEAEVPGAHLRATFSIAPNTDPAVDAALLIHVHPGNAIYDGPIAPGNVGFRDQKDGPIMPLPVSVTRRGEEVTLRVPRAQGPALLDGLGNRPWLSMPLRLPDNRSVALVLNLNGQGQTAIAAWLADVAKSPAPSSARAPAPSAAAAQAMRGVYPHRP